MDCVVVFWSQVISPFAVPVQFCAGGSCNRRMAGSHTYTHTDARTHSQALRRANKNTHTEMLARTHTGEWTFLRCFVILYFFLLYSLTHICMHKYASMCTCTCTYHTYVFNCFECVLGHFIFTLLVERVSADPRISLSRSCTRAPHYRWSSPSSFSKLSHVYFIFLSFYFYFCFWHFGASSFAYLFNLFQQQQQPKRQRSWQQRALPMWMNRAIALYNTQISQIISPNFDCLHASNVLIIDRKKSPTLTWT